MVHGGDIFYRSKVPAQLVYMAFEPLKRVADKGVPVYVVPGNHERSNIPYHILAAHPNIFVFDQPRSFTRDFNGTNLSLVGFPFLRRGIRKRFHEILEHTGYLKTSADVRILCMHQSVDGATMGPKNFMFRGGDDVVDAHDIPSDFVVVLSGHMHRHQVLQNHFNGKQIATPVLYAGSIERTSFAEKDETKGYMTISIEDNDNVQWRFHELPTRPMIPFEIDITNMNGPTFASWLNEKVKAIPADSIVRIKIHGKPVNEILEVIKVESLRSIAGETMNIDVMLVDYYNSRALADWCTA